MNTTLQIKLANAQNPLVTITRNPVDRTELLVYPRSKGQSHPATYFTTDLEDAIGTAQAMQKHLDALANGLLPAVSFFL